MSSPTTTPVEELNVPERPSGDVLTRDAEVLISTYLPSSPPPVYEGNIPSNESIPPLIVPQLSPGFDTPFARAVPLDAQIGYPSQQDILKFIDGLNLAIVASPPLRVVSLAGKVIGFVPYHWAMIAGTALQVGAETGMRVLSKTLSDRYLAAANKTLFNPHGLTVRLCTAKALRALVDPSYTSPDSDISKSRKRLNAVGRSVGGTLMKLPIPVVQTVATTVVRMVADKPARVAPSSGNPQTARVLRRVETVRAQGVEVARLELENIPPPASPKGVMDTMGNWSIKLKRWQEGRHERKADQMRRELLEIEQNGQDRPDPVGGGLRYGEGNRGGYIAQARAEQRTLVGSVLERRGLSGRRGDGLVGGLAGRLGNRTMSGGGLGGRGLGGRGLGGGLIGGLLGGTGGSSSRRGGGLLGPSTQEGKVQAEVEKADLLEQWETRKLLWIVIMHRDEDELIEGRHLVDDIGPDGLERVSEQEWKQAVESDAASLVDDVQEYAAVTGEASTTPGPSGAN